MDGDSFRDPGIVSSVREMNFCEGDPRLGGRREAARAFVVMRRVGGSPER
jgi:hypothetical protein